MARRRGLTIALAASVAVAIAGASALAALALRPTRKSETLPSTSHPITRARVASNAGPVSTPTPTVASDLPTASPPKLHPTVHPATARESYAAELELLKRAQVAYAGGSYTDALALVAEHGRRFPNGRLAEEREAMRVRALAKAGRTDESERAAAAFAERFPRSVLLARPSRAAR